MSSHSSPEGVIDENVEGVVYRTDYSIREGPGGKVLGSTHVEAGGSKIGRSSLGNSLGSALGSGVGT